MSDRVSPEYAIGTCSSCGVEVRVYVNECQDCAIGIDAQYVQSDFSAQRRWTAEVDVKAALRVAETLPPQFTPAELHAALFPELEVVRAYVVLDVLERIGLGAWVKYPTQGRFPLDLSGGEFLLVRGRDTVFTIGGVQVLPPYRLRMLNLGSADDQWFRVP